MQASFFARECPNLVKQKPYMGTAKITTVHPDVLECRRRWDAWQKYEAEQEKLNQARWEKYNADESWRTGTALDGLMKIPAVRHMLDLSPEEIDWVRMLAEKEKILGEPLELSRIFALLAMFRITRHQPYPTYEGRYIPDTDLDFFGRLARCSTKDGK